MSDSDSMSASRTDWQRLDAMSDDDIDTSDIPVLTDEFFKHAQWRGPTTTQVTISMNAVALAWFKSQGPDWEQRIDQALREYVKTHAGTDEDRASA
jgi:uncharacterized protein (DUF4415 family)